MSGFNLSEWALRHRSFTWYLILALTLAGGIAYTRLGREEDPAFAIKTMVVQTAWPGATIDDTINLVTDPIEKKLEEVPYLDYVKSYTRPGFVGRLRQPEGLHARRGNPGPVVSGAQEDRRHEGHPAAGHPGTGLQRRVRRYLRYRLRLHGRRFQLP